MRKTSSLIGSTFSNCYWYSEKTDSDMFPFLGSVSLQARTHLTKRLSS